MGAAADILSAGQREAIAREILVGALPNMVGGKVSSHCPLHDERTKGGAFFYDPEEDVAFCHSCGQSQDLIGLWLISRGMDPADPQGFREFFERFAPGRLGEGRREHKPRERARVVWTPRVMEPCPDLWRQQAMAMVEKYAQRLQQDAEALDRLAQWGVTPETAKACQIGWLHEDRYFKFTTWGLPYEENAKGNERCIRAPKGFVFPCFAGGLLRRIKVRADEPNEHGDRYAALAGGEEMYGIWGKPEQCRMWIIVETERDAMFCWQELRRYGIGAMSPGSASKAPDSYAHSILARADVIINALDNDQAGAKKSWSYIPDDPRFCWDTAYPHAVRWLVPSCIGKDVGDLPRAGVKVWDWLRRGLPVHVLRACERNAQRHDRALEQIVRRVEWPSPDVLAAIPAPEGCGPWDYDYVLTIAAQFGLQPEVGGNEVRLVYRDGYAQQSDEIEDVMYAMNHDPRIGQMLRDAARAQGGVL